MRIRIHYNKKKLRQNNLTLHCIYMYAYFKYGHLKRLSSSHEKIYVYAHL